MVGYVIKDKLKKGFSIVLMTVLIGFMIFLVTGCENDNDKPQEEVVKKTYTITFNSDGGSSVESQTVTEGGSAVRPLTPTKEGYEFLAWTYNGENFNFSDPVNSDMTLVATWAEKEQVWIVTLDLDDGSLTKKVNVKKGEKLEKPETPTRDGYDFVSWQLDGKDYDFNKVVEKDITLKATWKEKKLKVTFDSKGGTAVAAQEISINGVVKAPKEPTKNGWTFVEWQFEGKKYDFKAEVKTDMTLVATWKLSQTYQKEESITKKLNGKNAKIDFRYINKTDKEEVDIFVNDIKVLTSTVYFVAEGCNLSDFAYCVESKDELSSAAQSMVNRIKEELKVIKGDKEYLTIRQYGDDGYKIAIVSDSGSVLYSDHFADGLIISGFELEKSCPNYDKFVVGEDKVQHYYAILNDGVYHLEKTAGYQISEYKTTISKNKVVTTKVATCLGWTSSVGGKVDEFSYIITKTQKVNNKNVNIEYRFVIPYAENEQDLDELMGSPLTTADLYIDGKLIEKNFYADEVSINAEDYEKLTAIDIEANMTYAANHWKEISTKLDKMVGVVSGDKQYLYVLGTNKILVLDDKYNKIFDKKMLYFDERDVYLENSCLNVDKFALGGTPIYNGFSRSNLYYITKDAIYYIDDNGACPSEVEGLTLEESQQLSQYKVTFKSNAANMEKIATCKFTADGNCH